MVFDSDVCRKFTSLEEDDIQYLLNYSAHLQELADQSGSDIFLDCRSGSGRSAVVVGEAKPVRKGNSAYDHSLIGLIVPWENEPAVDRTFRLGVQTAGIATNKTPGGAAVAQFVTPIYREDRLLGVLIYEVQWPQSEQEEIQPLDEEAEYDDFLEAVLRFDGKGIITYANHSAKKLFREIGYVENLIGMKVENIWRGSFSDRGVERDSAGFRGEIQQIGSFTLRGTCIPDSQNKDSWLLLLEDLSEREKLRHLCEQQQVEKREFVHRMKNSIQLLSETFEYKANRCEDSQIKMVYHEASARSIALLAGVGSRRGEHDAADLYQMLKIQCGNIAEMLNRPPIELHGRSVLVSNDQAVILCMVVNELIFNSLKYAYKNVREGRIDVNLEPGELYHAVTVTDYGCGFNPDEVISGTGLDLIREMVQERLNGDLEIRSGPEGTRVIVRFLIV